MHESDFLQVDLEPNLGGNTLQEVNRGAALEVRQDWEVPDSALQDVAAKFWAGICPVDARRHAERNEVEVYSGSCFVEYMEEQVRIPTDVR